MWMCLRLVAGRHASWTEVTQSMSLDDADRLNMAVDILFDAEHTPPPPGAPGVAR